MRGTLVLLLLHLIPIKVFCANILFASDVPSPSHKIWNFALAEGLTLRGHNVTMLGPDAFTNLGMELENYHAIYFQGIGDLPAVDFEGWESLPLLDNMYTLYNYQIDYCKYLYKTNGFQAIIDYPKDFKFDVILFDVTCGPCLLPLMKQFNYPPTVGVTAFLLPPFLSHNFGNDMQPSYLPSFYLRYSSNMIFLQRLHNYFVLYLDVLLRRTYLNNNVYEMIKQQFGDDVDSLQEMEDHISLLLCNLDPVVNLPQPLTPNIIPVGGLHLKQPKELSKDLQKIMDEATEGVILFSLGTNMRSDQLKEDKKRALFETFRKIKQTIIWKFESNCSDYDIAKNVIIRNWLPQNDILAHPNTKLFISHGGGLSLIEAAYHGVPIIGIPFFVDQHMNVMEMVDRQAGIQLEYSSINSEKLVGSIEEILQNPKYSNNMNKLSRRMRDQPQTPLERAIFWVEYTMRHNGTHFLDSGSRKMSLFVKSCTDIHIFILSCVLVFAILLKLLWSKRVKLFRRNTKQKMN